MTHAQVQTHPLQREERTQTELLKIQTQLLKRQMDLLERVAEASEETKDATTTSAGWPFLGICSAWLASLYVATYINFVVGALGGMIPDFLKPAVPFISHVETVTGSPAVIVSVAEKWVGKDFNAGKTAQCAYFVRRVLSDAGVSVGVTTAPYDGYASGEGFANSFFGADIGTLIESKEALRPGDLVAFANTYGEWESGTITHVGIYVGDGQMVDRPTANEPVQRRSIDTFTFAVGVRLPGVGLPAFPDTTAPVFVSNVTSATVNASKADKDYTGYPLEQIAIDLEQRYGIVADFTIANGNHESAYGSAIIGGDNWFGVKSVNGAGVATKTTEWYGGTETSVTDSFCNVGCPDSFARTIVNILAEKGLSPHGMSAEEITANVASVYATDPAWADKMLQHIRRLRSSTGV
ncbi:glucosaminidase domain-containing protein [Roseofilum capinflatum]|uniref:Glucosaminidase domain-containing protein n=1 Tax=Roseofilum capinflatum BLCC-M114 TaxID=3022440 RepID=A0ABT7B8H1_9CYAN|nr:glucosaminidase domain-containing protein [Roseofilum capinflatum]MDJ1174889.1 glucosaminidase domain-containing protein [Roseofilum capinflatum BLCC-M114]